MLSVWKSQPLQAALILAGLVIVFLWTPITSGGYYAPTDILNDYALFHGPPDERVPKNGLLSDVMDQILPFIRWNRTALQGGQLPLWNPYNGAGAPHLANFQSAVFSPFNLPYYALNFRWALIVVPFSKLFALGFFTYLFLRQVGLRHSAALLGGVAYMFGGYHILWLSWPHAGVSLVVPMGLYCVELALENRLYPMRRLLALIGVTLALALGLLAGHPETFLYDAALVGLYVLFRLLVLPVGWRQRLRAGVELAVTPLLAIGLAAVQLVPFYEYLRESATFASRNLATHANPLIKNLIPLLFFPNLLGNPSLPYSDPALTRLTNYNEVNGGYMGLTVLFLAGLTVLTLPWHKSALAAFFTGVMAAWFAYAYNLFGVGAIITMLGPFKLALPTRSFDIWLFSVSVLAALGWHFLLRWAARQEADEGRPMSSVLLLGVGWLWTLTLALAAMTGAYLVIQRAAMQPDSATATWAARYTVLPHVAFLGGTFLLACACAAALIANGAAQVRRPWLPPVASALVIGLVFLQTGYLLKDYNPTVAPRFFYPVTPILREALQRIGDATMLSADAGGIPPNANLWYQIRQPANYDAMGIIAYHDLYAQLVQSPRPEAMWDIKPLHLRALQILGVQYVLTTRPYPFASTPGLELVQTVDPLRIFRVPGSPPRYFTVSQAVVRESTPAALTLLEQPDFDLLRTVVLHDNAALANASQSESTGMVQVVSETPSAIHLRVDRATPGWLVALQAFYPGWKARVNGQIADLRRANVAFTAVPLGAGTSDVELVYDPLSVKIGALVSLLTGLGLVVVAAAGQRLTRSPAPTAAPDG